MVQEVRRWCGTSGLPAYNPKTQRGFWRFLVLREGKRTAQTLVHLITTDQGDPAAVEALAAFLKARFPSITTLVHSRRRQKAQIASGGSSRTLWGPGYIEEQLGQLRLRISPHSFFKPILRPPKACIAPSAGSESLAAKRPFGISTAAPAASPSLWPRKCAGW